MQDPHQKLERDHDEILDRIDQFEAAARAGRIAFEEGDLSAAVAMLDEVDNVAGDSWRKLVELTEQYRDNAAELYETGEITERGDDDR